MKTLYYIILILLTTLVSYILYPVPTKQINYSIIKETAETQREFILKNGLSQNYCIVVNYKYKSGSPRVFVYDFNSKSIVYKAHTMHGAGKNSTSEVPVFSNELGSKCSCLGKFKITKTHGTLNPKGFKLQGLEKYTANAWKRGLMLHSSYWVNDNLGKEYIPLNEKACQGCITTSTKELKTLSKYIYSEKKLLLLISINK